MNTPADDLPSDNPPSGDTPADAPPDRLSNDPRSRYHDEALLERGVGIRFNGEERHNVEE